MPLFFAKQQNPPTFFSDLELSLVFLLPPFPLPFNFFFFEKKNIMAACLVSSLLRFFFVFEQKRWQGVLRPWRDLCFSAPLDLAGAKVSWRWGTPSHQVFCQTSQ